MPAMRHHVAAGEAMVAEQGEGAQVFHQTVAERAVELQPVAVRPHAAMAQQVARVLVREQILAGRHRAGVVPWALGLWRVRERIARSEQRRVGTGWVGTCRSWWG